MGNLSEELATSHKSILAASTSIISNTATLTTAANDLVSLYAKIEEKIKALDVKEQELKKKEEGIDKKNNELDNKKSQMDTREKQLNQRELAITHRENEIKEMDKRMETTSANLNAIIQLNVGGQFFDVPKVTLLQYKGSYFEAMLTSKHAQQVNSKYTNRFLIFYFYDERIYYIDYSPKAFAEVLEFMRSKKLGRSLLNHQDECKQHFGFFKIPIPEVLPPAIHQWLPKRTFLLLYKATRDGFDKDDFHRVCDNKGPTISIIQSDKGYLFGGYTPISWESTDKARDPTNPAHFIFTLTNPHNIPPTQYKLKNPVNSLGHRSGMHVAFGDGIDLRVSDMGANLTADSYSNFSSYSYIDTTGKGKETFTGSSHFVVKEVEVYLVV